MPRAGAGLSLPRMPNERCPLCQAEVSYLGLDRVECPTRECPNYSERADAPAKKGEQLRLELDQLMYELWCRARARL